MLSFLKMEVAKKVRNVLASALLSAVLAGAASTAMARTYGDVEVAPPAPREEVVPRARAGYEWAPGYWDWNGHRHVWVKGHFVRSRGADYQWVPHQWNEQQGRYHMEQGHWERRADGRHDAVSDSRPEDHSGERAITAEEQRRQERHDRSATDVRQ